MTRRLARAALAGDLQPEAVEIDELVLLRLADAAALQGEAEEAPQAGLLAVVVEARVVGVALQHPPPQPAFAARVGFLLPALEHARNRLEGGPAGLRVADRQPALVGGVLQLGARQHAQSLEQAMLQGRGAPGRPEVDEDSRGLERQAVELEAHRFVPRGQQERDRIPSIVFRDAWAR